MYAFPDNPIHDPTRRFRRATRLLLADIRDGESSVGLRCVATGSIDQFVGFLAGFREAAPFTPLVGGLLGTAMTLWVVFVPSMLWIFAGAPFVEQLRGDRRLAGALAAITAAVVGVILNLAVWFALHVLFGSVTERHTGWLRWYAVDVASLDVAAAKHHFRQAPLPPVEGRRSNGLPHPPRSRPVLFPYCRNSRRPT